VYGLKQSTTEADNKKRASGKMFTTVKKEHAHQSEREDKPSMDSQGEISKEAYRTRTERLKTRNQKKRKNLTSPTRATSTERAGNQTRN